ncbi:DUF1707 SHOCT-like domain-containing protein [Saccharothrix australiensis]|uniref:Uncharacterized protein DUF1707 n=1 Tax=Saccharothrix australiensis TaxID=2072 RepID=A0A495W9E9_9PSEU|nr:DUF1707 domain-containing protein [Saccharothrix australiensis]RKT57740.1 uncharacterized protein DUF1707 [Saccharothrix australiensis]
MTDFQREDRAAVSAELARAKAEGRLTEDEYAERIRGVAAARNYTELVALTADLPAGPPIRRAEPSRRWRYAAYLVVTGINVLVWGVLSLWASFALYPWWIWVALLGGLLVLLAP